MFVFQGGTFTSTDSWAQGTGGAGGGNMILEWATDAATTRKQVKAKERKAGMQISYLSPTDGWINEQYVGNALSDAEWAKDGNWTLVSADKELRYRIDSIEQDIFYKDYTTKIYGVSDYTTGNVWEIEGNRVVYTGGGGTHIKLDVSKSRKTKCGGFPNHFVAFWVVNSQNEM